MKQKYRAWDKYRKQWVEHFYITENGLIYNMKKPRFDFIGAVPIEKSDMIVMQSTGLFDSSEPPKEIFKDDIVTTTRFTGNSYKTYTGVVKCLEGCWVIDTGNGALYLWSDIDENTVIGNIHQHPHLLEESE